MDHALGSVLDPPRPDATAQGPAPEAFQGHPVGQTDEQAARIVVPEDVATLTRNATGHVQADVAGAIARAEQHVPLHVRVGRFLHLSGVRETHPTDSGQHERSKLRQRAETLLRVGLAAGVLATAAACTVGSGRSHAQGPPSPTAAAAATAIYHEKIQNLLDEGSIHDARVALKHPPPGLLAPATELGVAAEDLVASDAALDVPEIPDAGALHEAQRKLDRITNPELKAEAGRAMKAEYVEAVADDAESNIYSDNEVGAPGAEEELHRALKAINDPKMADAGEQILISKEAESTMDNYIPNDPPTTHDIQSFMKGAEKITDPAVRHAVIRSAQAQTAESVMNDVGDGYSGFSIEKARKFVLENITDTAVRDRTMKALATYETDGFGDGFLNDTTNFEAVDEMQYQDDRVERIIQNEVDKLAGIPLKPEETVDEYYSNQAAAAEKQDQIALDNALADYNGPVNTEVMTATPHLKHPHETLNFATVDGTTQVPNVGQSDYSESSTDPEMLDQFAEIYVKDGSVQFEIPPEAGLSKKTVARMQEVFNNIKPILEAGFSKGSVNSIRFIISDEFNPYYEATSHEVIMVLPRNKMISMQELQGAITHEVGHALTRELFAGETPPSKAETNLIVNTCSTLRDTTYSTLQSDLKYVYPDLLQDLYDQASNIDKPLIKTVMDAVKAGDVANVYGAKLFQDTNFNECLPATLGDLFAVAMDETPKFPDRFKYDTDKFNEHFQSTIAKLPAFNKLLDVWDNDAVLYTIYQTLNEANYVENFTNNPDAQFEGHTEDDSWELVASLFDNAVNYPKELGRAIGQLTNDAETGHQRDAAARAVTATLRLISSRYPSLWQICDNSMHKVAIAARVNPDSRRYMMLPKR